MDCWLPFLLFLWLLSLGLALGSFAFSLLFVLARIGLQGEAVIHRRDQKGLQVLKRVQDLLSSCCLFHGRICRHPETEQAKGLAAANKGNFLCSVLEPG